MSQSTESARLVFVVPKGLVKKVKTYLEQLNLLDRSTKIRACTAAEINVAFFHTYQVPEEAFFVPTLQTIELLSSSSDANMKHALEKIESDPSLLNFKDQVGVLLSDPSKGRAVTAEYSRTQSRLSSKKNGLDNIFGAWLQSLPNRRQLDADIPHINRILSSSISAHSILNAQGSLYAPMLLLQPSYLKDRLKTLTSTEIEEFLPDLWKSICQLYGVTHIALNGHIPMHEARSSKDRGPLTADSPIRDNIILRSPTQFKPLWGNFGPELSQGYKPHALDFEEAFWCNTSQNDIHQTWAPRYTMFSKGNLSEKARVKSLARFAGHGTNLTPSQTSAVDLYAGIGYFAFSYASAGVGKVLCWEINDWSIEGLKRGAQRNGWAVKIMQDDDPSVLRAAIQGAEKLLMFPNSNSDAVNQISVIRDLIPPVRHVNCGYLPSSEASWEVAVRVLDPVHGGWIHAHENIANQDIERRRSDVVETFTSIVSDVHRSGSGPGFTVTCEHLERVKSYSPGVFHYVLDINIFPSASNLRLSPTR